MLPMSSLQLLVLSFYHVSSWNGSWIFRRGSKSLDLLSHLTRLYMFFNALHPVKFSWNRECRSSG